MTWTNTNKASTSFANQSANVASYTNQDRWGDIEYLLREQGDFLLREQGDKIYLESVLVWANQTKN